jgi:ABC-2 type transport system ATP-binding protein
VGIDPQSRNHILDTVRSLNREGMTVIYTSHYMQEVEELCDRVAIIDHGRAIAMGTLDELGALVGDEDRVRITLDSGMAPDAAERILAHVRAVEGVSTAALEDGSLEVFSGDAGAVLGGVVEALTLAQAAVRTVEIVEPNLESVFLHLTGRGLRD